MKLYIAELPWPATVNKYWRIWQGRVLISTQGREYRKTVQAKVFADFEGQLPRWEHRLSVEILAYPPDRRQRDLDNLLKSTLDSLQHAGVYQDDSQIDEMTIFRRTVQKSGAIVVSVREAT